MKHVSDPTSCLSAVSDFDFWGQGQACMRSTASRQLDHTITYISSRPHGTLGETWSKDPWPMTTTVMPWVDEGPSRKADLQTPVSQ